jgi:hypothetical protein
MLRTISTIFSYSIKKTLEDDIKKCLVELRKSTTKEKILLDKQLLLIDEKATTWKGTFEVYGEKLTRMGTFEANTKYYGFQHNIFSKKPMYKLIIDYKGERIETKYNMFHTKYIREPLFY